MTEDENDSKTLPWVKDKVLGTGGFGTVTLWYHNDTGETVALKKCRWGSGADSFLTPKHIDRWEKEVEIMNKLDHRAVVKCFPVPQELLGQKADLPMLCMEYCKGGDLRKVLNRAENCCGLKEAAIRDCLKDIVDAVAYLHSMRIIHRDLKPENIVLQDVDGQTRYKLIDLGYAKELEQSSVCTSFVGTLQYLAPELFLSKRYTCTVDFWSLGLVTHEIVTGVRPFLPNMTPVEWMKRVHSKQSHHICVYEGRDGEIKFSSTMFPESHISLPLKKYIESWLQLMLEWEPTKRGQEEVGGNTGIVAFSKMHDILDKKIVKVFVVNKCQLYEYEVEEGTSIFELQNWIAQNSEISVEDQRPLLPRGQPPQDTLSAMQCWAPSNEEEWLLYIFSETASRPSVPCRFPALVEEMLRHPKTLVDYQIQRRMWAHAVFFLHRESATLTLLNQAQKVLMLHLISSHAQLNRIGRKMLSDVAKLRAKHHLFVETMNTDLDCYDEQPESAVITSELMYNCWREVGEEVMKEVHNLVEQVQQVEASLNSLNSSVSELQCSPFAQARSQDTLANEVSQAENLYNTLRRRNKESRAQSHDCTDMCRQLVQALRKRDKLHQDLYKYLEKQSECLSKVACLSSPLESLLLDIARCSSSISEHQKRRQKDIWKLVEIAATYGLRKGSGFGQSTPREPPKVTSPPRPPPPSLNDLSAILEKSSKETRALVSENRALRCQMVEILASTFPMELHVE